MCQECYAAVCPSTCPYKRDDGAHRAHSARRGEPIFEDGGYFANGERAICDGCADEITVEELIEILRLSDTGELLSLLGFRYHA